MWSERKGATELLELIPTAKLIDVAGAGHMGAGDDTMSSVAG